MTKTSPLFQKQGKVDKCFVWVMSFFNACYQVVSSFHVLIRAIFFNWKCRRIMLIIQFPFRFHFALRRADTRVLHLSKDKAVTSRYRNDFPFSLWPIFSISLFCRKTSICPAGKTFISFPEQSAPKFYGLIIWKKKVTYKTLENFPHVNLTDHKIRSLSSALASGQPVMAWGPWWGKTWAAGLILATPTTLKCSPHLRWS